jgi:anthranilate phosphoribosyltransferase
VAVYRGLRGDDLVSDLEPAMAAAAESIDSGAAAELLTRWTARSKELAAG